MTATGTYAPIPGEQYEDANGNPAVGYRLFTYLAGLSTKVNTYTDVGLSVANANPLTLGSDARPTVMLTPGISYKFVLALPGSDDPPASVLWTRDNISAVAASGTATDTEIAVTAGENLAAADSIYVSDGSGGQTAGRAYRSDADATFSSTTPQIIGFATAAVTSGASGTMRRLGRMTGLSGLVAGTTYYVSATAGGLTSTAPTNARAVLVADGTTTGDIICGEPMASATIQGVVSYGAQTLGDGAVASIKTVGGLTSNSSMTYKPGSASAVIATASGLLTASVDTTQHANSGTGLTTLSSYSLPANVLASNGMAIRVKWWGSYAANANTKSLFFKFGATTFNLESGGINGIDWIAEAVVIRTGAATQKVIAESRNRTAGILTRSGTAAETLSGAITILTQGQSGTASSDILQEGFAVEILG